MRYFVKKNSTGPLYLAIIVLISIIGGVIAIYTTANGPWGYSDPVEYISTARSILEGRGIGYYEADAMFNPTTIHPPFYSIVLAAIGLLKVDLVAASRWLNILAFMASIFIAGWIFLRFSRAPGLGIIASALMCVFPFMVVIFSSSYSEPLTILLFLSGGLCLLACLQKGEPLLFVVSALLIGLIPITRYAGVAMVIAAAASILLLTSGKFWRRVWKAALFTLIASLPTILWFVHLYFVTSGNTLGGRDLGSDTAGLGAQFQAFRGIFMDTIWKWVPFQANNMLLRYRLRFILLGVALAGILALALLAQRRLNKASRVEAHNTGMWVFTFFGLSAVLYVALLLATYLFTHPTIDIDNRMLLPLYVSSVMSFYGAFALWQAAWFNGRKRLLQGLPWLLAAVCIYWYYPQTQEQVELFHHGDGLTAYRWDRSETIKAVRALPADIPVISNDWELLLLWTQRPIYGFWNTFPAEAPYQTTRYGTDSADNAQSVFCSQGAALVVFNDFPTQVRERMDESFLPQLPALFDGLTIYGNYSDGTIYLCH
jgi:hypothetical protein